MRIRRRYAVALAVTAISALAVAGIAMAAADGNSSTISFKFSPVKVPKKKYKPGKIRVHTHTNFANPNNIGAGGNVSRVQIWFDDDFKFSTGSVPQCTTNLTGDTMKQAMAACSTKKIGAGTAEALAGTNPTVTPIPVCVLDFNGPKQNNHPTILLFSRVGTSDCSDPANNETGGTSIVLTGELKNASGDFGKQLDVNPVYPNATLALDDFDTTIKRGGYVKGRCHDGNHKWNVKAKFKYTDGQSDSASHKQRCRVRH